MTENHNLISRRELAALVPVDRLSPEGFNELASKVEVETQPAGRTLFVEGPADNWTYYLLEGELDLVGRGGGGRRLRGGSEETRHPVADARRRDYTARTRTPIRFVRIDTELLGFLQTPDGESGFEIEEIGADDPLAQNRLFNEMYHEYMADRLVLPAMPEIAVQVRRAIQDPRNDIANVAKIVQMDPALTARLIQVANSPLFRGQTRIDNCRAAITRLGLNATRNLVVSFTLHGIFKSRSAVLHERMTALWQHSSRVAALSYVLAQRTPGFDADRAMLAGLVHDIGILPLLSHVERYPELILKREQLDQAAGALRGTLGAMILRKWRFSSDLVTVALEAENWMRDPATRPDYCDVVLVAQLHSFVGTPGGSAYPPLDSVPAFAKLALGTLGPEASLAILEEAREDVESAMALLKT